MRQFHRNTRFRCDVRYGQLLRSTHLHYARWFQMSVLRNDQILLVYCTIRATRTVTQYRNLHLVLRAFRLS